MSDWNKYLAFVRDRSGTKHSPPEFPVIVYGVTIDTAREKLVEKYPARSYEITSLTPSTLDPLSDPNSYKGAKGPNDT